MTVCHGSIEAMPGHIRVSTLSLAKSGGEFQLLNRSVINSSQPIPYRFISHKGKIYYVNGSRKIYETNIDGDWIVNVVFDPVCSQLSYDDLTWRPIQFRPITYLEWVFL
jgi:hypothetical protein